MATTIITTRSCILCGESTALEVDADKYRRWREGTHIQHVWPEWTPDQRELLITGTHPECWDRMFPDEEE